MGGLLVHGVMGQLCHMLRAAVLQPVPGRFPPLSQRVMNVQNSLPHNPEFWDARGGRSKGQRLLDINSKLRVEWDSALNHSNSYSHAGGAADP